MNTRERRPSRCDHQYVNLFISKLYITISSLLSHACQGSYLLFTERWLKKGVMREHKWKLRMEGCLFWSLLFPVLRETPPPCLCVYVTCHAENWFLCTSLIQLIKLQPFCDECNYDFMMLPFPLNSRWQEYMDLSLNSKKKKKKLMKMSQDR